MKLKVSVVFVLFMAVGLACSSAYAVTGTATGKIDRIYTYHNGNVLFGGLTFTDATCNNKSGFFIAGTHPHLEKYLSILLMAKATNSDVTVVAKVNDCWYPQITESGETTYFYIH